MNNPTEIKRIVIETIAMREQRYNTVGDWFFHDETLPRHFESTKTLVIRVSDTGNWKWNMALALHELSEAILCTSSGVTQDEVDKFDIAWQSRLPEDSEPGDDVRAPYHKQHRVASQLELQFFDELHPMLRQSDRAIEWQNYESKLDELTEEYERSSKGQQEDRTEES